PAADSTDLVRRASRRAVAGLDGRTRLAAARGEPGQQPPPAPAAPGGPDRARGPGRLAPPGGRKSFRGIFRRDLSLVAGAVGRASRPACLRHHRGDCGRTAASARCARGNAGRASGIVSSLQPGPFAEAAAAYEKIVAGGRVSSALYFNLGNALFKSGRIGRAIANYRLAEQLAPRDPDIRANLRFARNHVNGVEARLPAWWRR